MKPILCLSLLLSVCALADEAADRVAIEKALVTLNEFLKAPIEKPLPNLFTPDVDIAELNRLRTAHGHMRDHAGRPWSEVSMPRIVSSGIRFVTADVALVDATDSQFGSLTRRNLPVLLVMKKQGADWRIISLRMGAE